MRSSFVLLLLCSLAALPVQAQQLPAGSVSVSSAAGGQVRRVMAPPKSVQAQGQSARSTAQTMAAHADLPLAHMPALAVTDGNGKAAEFGSVRASGHWLLLYRTEHCPACDKVTAALGKSESPLFKQGTPYVIVVKRSGVTPSAGMLSKLKDTYPTLSNATWVEDSNGEASRALKPMGEPVLYAVSGNDIAWAMHGTLNNPAMLERLASSWLASTSKPRPVATGSEPIVAATANAASTATTSSRATALHTH